MRCFLAVDIPDPLKRRIGAAQAELRNRATGVRWVGPSSMHLTLKFLGDLNSKTLPEVEQTARAAAGLTPRIVVRLAGLGAFPSLNRPRVFWVGVHEEGGGLADLARRLEQGLIPVGFPAEERSWSPHITVGRVRDPFALKALTDYIRIAAQEFEAGEFTASELVLYQSVLRPEGALYTPLKRFAFEGG